MKEEMRTFNKEKIMEMIFCLDGIYSTEAMGYASELERMVGAFSQYSDGDELTDDDINLLDTVNEYINN